jgi:hypothetical protein
MPAGRLAHGPFACHGWRMNATIAIRTVRPSDECDSCAPVLARDRIAAAGYVLMLVLVASFLALVGVAALA